MQVNVNFHEKPRRSPRQKNLLTVSKAGELKLDSPPLELLFVFSVFTPSDNIVKASGFNLLIEH